jgi:dihydrofolate reductase
MASWWPSPAAAQADPVVAARMNASPKVVFSRTLERADWNGTTLVKGDLVAEVRRMKETPGEDLAILGSGTIAAQLAQAGLIDELQIVINPIVLGRGKSLFEGVRESIHLEHTRTRTFGNGCMLLCYRPRA